MKLFVRFEANILALLLWWCLYQHTLAFQLRPATKLPVIPPLTKCHQSFSLNDAMDKVAAMNAERLAIKEGRELIGKESGGVQPLLKLPLSKLVTKASAVAQLVELEGCLSVSDVLSQETATELLAYINAENARAKAAVEAGEEEFDDRFGGVNCRGLNGMFGNRQDMFLPMSEPVVLKAVKEATGNLRPLLNPLVGDGAMLHEVSSLVSDPGAPRQCVHADTIVLPCPQYPEVTMEPLYTFFIALQDVEDDMGHTVFLPKTHTPAAHLIWNTTQKQKENFIKINKAVQSKLRTGETALFDSRVLHCGRENTSQKRRVLFYFTLSRQQDWPLPNGLHGSNSVRREDRWRWRLCDLY